MGFQIGTACYSTQVQAAQAAASEQVGAIVGHAGAAYTVSASAVDATAITYVLTPVGGGTPITQVAPYTAQPCNLLEGSDGIALGWMVAACWIGVFCVMFLTRALRGETGASYGNA